MKEAKCKICRRLGVKLFLKGERCFGQKCEVIKRNYPPGIRSKVRNKKISEYGKGLMEKQKIRNWYNLSEKQFSRYVKEVLTSKNKDGEVSTGDLLIKRIESRLDNTVFRMGFASSHSEARQIVGHGHFNVNGKKVDIPSYHLKKGDEVEVRDRSKNKKQFQELKNKIKSLNPPVWISLDKSNLKGKIIEFPTLEEANIPIETSLIFEFYSK
jgi:small subunit ribosomal protein S4